MTPDERLDYVFATWAGVLARLIDVGAVLKPLQNQAEAEVTADDWQQVGDDWRQVGDDLRAAIGEAQRELPEQERQPQQLRPAKP